jgi:tetratricopeptide (TPR) repeat protein
MVIAPANICPIVLASILGVLTAIGTVVVNSQSEWQDPLAARIGPSEVDAANRTTEDWPICSSAKTSGSEADWDELDSDFVAGKRALANGEWINAITAFSFATVRDPRSADIRNYIGYAHWRAGELGPAMGSFQQALLINPRHRAAHEHLGELLLKLNDLAKAEEHFAALKEICLIRCKEFDDLQQAIAAYRTSSLIH